MQRLAPRFSSLLALLALWTLPASAQDADLSGARAPVEALYAALLEAMQGGESLGLGGRRELVAPAVDGAYDLEFMASKALGRHWRNLAEEQRTAWVRTFRDLTVNTYARRFSSFSGQAFEVGEVSAASRGTAVVQTSIRSPGEEPVEIRYRMRPLEEGGWRIIDVYLNGTVSELALRRSEYSSVIKREGFEYLYRSLREKIDRGDAES